LGASGDVLCGVEYVAHAHFAGCAGHELHEAACAGGGYGVGVSVAFLLDDGVYEGLVEGVEVGVVADNVVECFDVAGWGGGASFELFGDFDLFVVEMYFYVFFVVLEASGSICGYLGAFAVDEDFSVGS